MKNKFLIAALLFNASLSAYLQPIKRAKEEIVEAIFDVLETDTTIDSEKLRADCSFSTQIISVPFTVIQSGFYCLGNDLNGTTGSTQITINTNNVFIDLNGKRMANGAVGIVATNRTNIFIGNGDISSLTGPGIILTNCRNVVLENLTFLQDSTAVNAVTNQNLFMYGCNAYLQRVNGFTISNATDSIFENCIANNNGTNVGGSGFSFNQSLNTIINNCITNRNATHGLIEQNSQNSLFQNCVSMSNRQSGFIKVQSRSCNFEDCVANSNLNHGFALLNGSGGAAANRNNTLTNCSATENTLQGFMLFGNHHAIQNCEAYNNNSNGFWSTNTNHSLTNCISKFNSLNGFQLNGSSHTILDSIANFNGNVGILCAAAGAGQPISTSCQVRNNTATSNTNFGIQNLGTIPAAGVSTANRIYSNFANSNGATPLAASPGNTNFAGILNFVISPAPATVFNFTTNIAE